MVFGWLGGGNDTREAHTKELTKALPAARVAAEDGSMVDVTLRGGGRMRVFLPPKFPGEKPVLQLMQPTAHPWVDRYNQVNAPALEAWSGRSRLADAVREVVDALEEAASLAANEAEQTARVVARSLSDAAPPAPDDDDGGDDDVPMPRIPDAFPELLDGLDDAQLHALIDDPEALAAAVEGLPVLANARALVDDLRKSNLAEARRLAAACEAAEADRAACLALQAQLREKLATRDEMAAAAGLAPSADPLAAARKRHAKNAADRDAAGAALVEEWRSGALETRAFLDAFVAERTAHHRELALSRVPVVAPAPREYA